MRPRIGAAEARRGLDAILGQTSDDISAWFGAEAPWPGICQASSSVTRHWPKGSESGSSLPFATSRQAATGWPSVRNRSLAGNRLERFGEIAEGEELAVGAPDPADQAPALPGPRERQVGPGQAPTRGNRKLEKFLDAVNRDDEVKAWWYMAQTHAERLGMSDHSWVHMQIVLNIALRLTRLLDKGGVHGAMVTDHGMSARDTEVVVAGGALLHDVPACRSTGPTTRNTAFFWLARGTAAAARRDL